MTSPDLPQAAIDAAAEAIDAEFRAHDGVSKPRWARDLAIAALEAAGAAERAREAQLDHCPGCQHRYGTCDCECCAHVARAVAAERERIYAELGNEHWVTFAEDGWFVEHSVECRLSSQMPDCAYHAAVARDAGRGYDPRMAGRWGIAIDEDGNLDLIRQAPDA